MERIDIFIDGSCSGNPGPGGWAAICKENGKKKASSGHVSHTTNNKMELRAAIGGLLALKFPREVTLFTDSTYLISCWNHVTVENGKANYDWLTREDRANKELWIKFIEALRKGRHSVKFVKVTGHAGIEMNELADKFAKAECKKARHLVYGKK